MGVSATLGYRFGLGLYDDGKIQAMTHNIPTPEGKLRVIVERRAREFEDGREAAVKALLDVCDDHATSNCSCNERPWDKVHWYR